MGIQQFNRWLNTNSAGKWGALQEDVFLFLEPVFDGVVTSATLFEVYLRAYRIECAIPIQLMRKTRFPDVQDSPLSEKMHSSAACSFFIEPQPSSAPAQLESIDYWGLMQNDTCASFYCLQSLSAISCCATLRSQDWPVLEIRSNLVYWAERCAVKSGHRS